MDHHLCPWQPWHHEAIWHHDADAHWRHMCTEESPHHWQSAIGGGWASRLQRGAGLGLRLPHRENLQGMQRSSPPSLGARGTGLGLCLPRGETLQGGGELRDRGVEGIQRHSRVGWTTGQLQSTLAAGAHIHCPQSAGGCSQIAVDGTCVSQLGNSALRSRMGSRAWPASEGTWVIPGLPQLGKLQDQWMRWCPPLLCCQWLQPCRPVGAVCYWAPTTSGIGHLHSTLQHYQYLLHHSYITAHKQFFAFWWVHRFSVVWPPCTGLFPIYPFRGEWLKGFFYVWFRGERSSPYEWLLELD